MYGRRVSPMACEPWYCLAVLKLNDRSKYTLHGQVVISVPCLPWPLLGKLREIRRLHLSLGGKSEFFDQKGGLRLFLLILFAHVTSDHYTPLRLWKDHVDLIQNGEPVVLPSHHRNLPDSGHIHIAIPFHIRIPGWLPPSQAHFHCLTAYGLVAQASIGWSEDPLRDILPNKKLEHNKSLRRDATSSPCSSFVDFSLRRHRMPISTPGNAQELGEKHFAVRTDHNAYSPVDCIVTVPEWIDVNGDERSFKIVLQMRAKEELCKAAEQTGNDAMDIDTSASSLGSSPEPGSVPMERDQGLTKPYYRAPSGTFDEETFVNFVELGMEVLETERYS